MDDSKAIRVVIKLSNKYSLQGLEQVLQSPMWETSLNWTLTVFFFSLQVLHFYQKKDTCYKGQREEILSYLTRNVREKRNVQREKKKK